MTYRFAVYSIQEVLKKTFDDAEITIPHIVYWISIVANKYISRDIEKGKRSGAYLSIFKNVTVHKDNDLGQHYIDMPKGMICVDHEGGVEFMSYNRDTCCCEGPNWAQQNFSITTAGKLEVLYEDEWEKPNPSNPYLYLVGGSIDGVNVDRIYLAGTECIHLRDVMMGIYCGVNPTEVCDLDDNIPIKAKYEDTLIREVLSLGRFMLLVPEDRVNEGSDTSKAPIVQAPRSVPAERTDQNLDQQ